MIRFIAQSRDGGRTILFVGLEHENIRRMLEGDPVSIDLAEDAKRDGGSEELPDLQVVIFAGKDRYTMLEDFRKRGIDVLAMAEHVHQDPDPGHLG